MDRDQNPYESPQAPSECVPERDLTGDGSRWPRIPPLLVGLIALIVMLVLLDVIIVRFNRAASQQQSTPLPTAPLMH